MKFEKASSNTPKPTKRWQWIDASSRKGLPEDYRPTFQKQRRRWVVMLIAGWLSLTMGMTFGDFIFNLFGGTLIMVLVFLGMIMGGLIVTIYALINLYQDQSITDIAQKPLAELDERQQKIRLQTSEIAFNLVIWVALLVWIIFTFSPEDFRASLLEFGAKNLAFPFSIPFLYLFIKPAIVAWLEPDPIPDDTVSIRQTAH